MSDDLYKKIPAVYTLIEELQKIFTSLRPDIIKFFVAGRLEKIRKNPRQFINANHSREQIEKKLLKEIEKQIHILISGSLKPVINATGVVLHTGLGRAPISLEVAKGAMEVCAYTNLEIDLESGKRGERGDHLSLLLQLLTTADDGLIVNNNAAAVMLTLNTVGRRKEVILSRGEMIEIGGSFRLPEVMRASGCKLKEVGTTNKTHIEDYAQAISEKTGAILICHPSNFEVRGFASKPQLEEIVELGRQNNIPVIYDLGSGSLTPSEFYGASGEPEIVAAVENGVDLISFSGDKLLGGPQTGIIVGKKEWVNKCRKNHLLRALRVDKFIIKILQNTLIQYLYNKPEQKLASLKMITATTEQLKTRLEKFRKSLPESIQLNTEIVYSSGKIGSGSFPLLELPSMALRIKSDKMNVSRLAKMLRLWETAIFTSIVDDAVQLDFRTVAAPEEKIIARAFVAILNKRRIVK